MSRTLPWALHPDLATARVVRGDHDGRDGGVAQFVFPEDAELAVRAANAHAALVEALKALRDHVPILEACLGPCRPGVNRHAPQCPAAMADAALALAGMKP